MTQPLQKTTSPYDCSTAETYTSCKLPKGLPDWWVEARKKPYLRFWDQGLPTQKLERFKYTNIVKLASDWDGILAEPKGDYADDIFEVMEKNSWVRDLVESDPPGLKQYADTALWDLNAAYFKYGGVVDIPADEVVDKPIYLKTIGVDDTYTSLRFILRLKAGAQVTLIEEFDGQGEYWRNRVSQIVLGENARLHHIIIQKDSDQSLYTQATHIQMGRDAYYNGFALNMGGAMTRHNIHADLNGAGAHAAFNGLNLLGGKQHGDTTILIEHKAPHCESRQFYRSLLNDSAHGVFQGKVHVHQIAQKTDGYQLSNAILLSDKAMMDTKPELEIYADDVKCSHGATTGQLNEEPLFYLRSRGLTEVQARLLLVQAFVDEVVDKIEDEGSKSMVSPLVEKWLGDVL